MVVSVSVAVVVVAVIVVVVVVDDAFPQVSGQTIAIAGCWQWSQSATSQAAPYWLNRMSS